MSLHGLTVHEFRRWLKQNNYDWLEHGVKAYHIHDAICTICERAGVEPPDASESIERSLMRVQKDIAAKSPKRPEGTVTPSDS